MPGTKRIPLQRQHTPQVTAQAVALYQRALKAQAKAHFSAELERAAHDAKADLDRLLGGGVRRLWEVSVFDVYRFQDPGDPDWKRKLELRRQLDAAVRELRRRQREVRRAARASGKATPEPEREPEPAV